MWRRPDAPSLDQALPVIDVVTDVTDIQILATTVESYIPWSRRTRSQTFYVPARELVQSIAQVRSQRLYAVTSTEIVPYHLVEIDEKGSRISDVDRARAKQFSRALSNNAFTAGRAAWQRRSATGR